MENLVDNTVYLFVGMTYTQNLSFIRGTFGEGFPQVKINDYESLSR